MLVTCACKTSTYAFFLLYTREPVFTTRPCIFSRWSLLWFSEFLCYFKAKEEPIARQHMHTCRFCLIMKSKNHSVLFWNFQGFFWVQWKVRWFLWLALELQAANYSFNETSGTVILSLCMSAHSCCGMHMCVCICWMIREWDPRIHSLECEVCVLSGPRGKECLPNSL